MLDLNRVALFVQVVDAGSFAEAARRLNMPANTVSRQVQHLEEELGVRLMQRSTRKLTLTEAGHSLHERSALQVEQLMAAADQLSGSAQAPRGTIRVATTADFFDFFPAGWIGEFLQIYPEIRLELVMSDIRADVIGEGIDLALRGGEMNDSNLVARKLCSFRVGLVASPVYLSERGTPASLADLSSHDCVKSSRPGSRTTWRLTGAEGTVEVTVSGRISSGTARSQVLAVMAGLGIGLLPTLLTCRQLCDGALLEVLPDYGCAIDIYAVYPSRKLLTRSVSVFIEFVERKLISELVPILEEAHGLQGKRRSAV